MDLFLLRNMSSKLKESVDCVRLKFWKLGRVASVYKV